MYVIYAYSEASEFACLDAILIFQNRPDVGKHIIRGRKGISVAGRYDAVLMWRLQSPAGS